VFEPAPAWRRLVARTIDLAIAFPLALILCVPVTIVGLPLVAILNSSGNEEAWGPIGAGLALLLAYVCLEWLLLIRRDGQTLGKGLMGLRVVRASRADRAGGSRLAGVAAIARLAVLLAPFAFLSAAGSDEGPDDAWDILAYVGVLSLVLSLLLAAIPASRRSVHDLAAGSRVVRAPTRPVHLIADLRMAMPVPQVNLSKTPEGPRDGPSRPSSTKR